MKFFLAGKGQGRIQGAMNEVASHPLFWLLFLYLGISFLFLFTSAGTDTLYLT